MGAAAGGPVAALLSIAPFALALLSLHLFRGRGFRAVARGVNLLVALGFGLMLVALLLGSSMPAFGFAVFMGAMFVAIPIANLVLLPKTTSAREGVV